METDDPLYKRRVKILFCLYGLIILLHFILYLIYAVTVL